MKKTLLTFLSLTLVAGFLGAQAPVPSTKADVKIINGFNFDNHTFSTSLDSKVQAHLLDDPKLLAALVIGHSQGGLTGAGYVNKAKNVHGFITVDSPVVGFSGLDWGYAAMQSRLFSHIRIHDRAIGGVLAAAGPVIGNELKAIWSMFSTKAKLAIILSLIGDIPFKDLMNTILLGSSTPGPEVREITDMGKASAYVQSNVRSTWIEKVRYIHHMELRVRVEWRTGWWGVRYPVVVWYHAPVYAYRDVEHYIPKLNPTLVSNGRVGHVVGTDNDPLHMAPDAESSVRGVMNTVKTVYNVAGGVNVAWAVLSFPFGTAYYSDQASRSFRGADWISNYKSEWGDIIGGSSNDAFITTRSQTVGTTPAIMVRNVYVDHKHSTPPATDDIINQKFGHEGTKQVWGKNGAVHNLAKQMGHFYYY